MIIYKRQYRPISNKSDHVRTFSSNIFPVVESFLQITLICFEVGSISIWIYCSYSAIPLLLIIPKDDRYRKNINGISFLSLVAITFTKKLDPPVGIQEREKHLKRTLFGQKCSAPRYFSINAFRNIFRILTVVWLTVIETDKGDERI